MADYEECLDYDDLVQETGDQQNGGVVEGAGDGEVKGNYVSIHSSGFRDLLLKPELLRAIVDCGFEHPSEGEGWSSFFDPRILKSFYIFTH